MAAAKKKKVLGPPAPIVHRKRSPNKATLADAIAKEHLKPAVKEKPPRQHGLPRKLNRYQELEIQVRNFQGESERSLAKESGVSQSALRHRNVVANSDKMRAVAKDLARAELAQAALPLQLQVCTRQLADELKLVAMNIAATARHGSDTARHLSLVAKTQAAQIDADNADGPEGLRLLATSAAYTEVANKAAHVGLNLLNANKELARDAVNTIDVTAEAVPDDPVRAAQAYQRMVRG